MLSQLRKYLAVTCISVFGFCANAAPIISDITGGTEYDSYYGSTPGDVIGFAFTADVDLTATALGVWIGSDGVLNSSHQVGLWDLNSQSLLGSVVVDNSDLLLDSFRYADLSSALQLTAGTSYVLGAVFEFDDGDGYISSPSSVTTSNVTILNAVFPAAEDLGFIFPTGVTQSLGRFGPNMLAEQSVTNDVPAPGTFALLLLSVGILKLRRR